MDGRYSGPLAAWLVLILLWLLWCMDYNLHWNPTVHFLLMWFMVLYFAGQRIRRWLPPANLVKCAMLRSGVATQFLYGLVALLVLAALASPLPSPPLY
jgi:hypothetical protein